ncbi:hypothetical protein [Polycladidibacter hongkongensis]|uniref:hypothetical protein n=1 Tax=Polycladidibacter hongkongensis TaxID=1647556 RepID=UPI000832CF2F|nr:hypothetical protein [Pseudovibrio hongkongensis]
MVDAGKLFLQFLRIVFGFCAAVIACGIFIIWGLFSAEGGSEGLVSFFAIYFGALVSSSIIGSLAIIPASFAIVLSEISEWRGVIFHVSAGGVIALVIWWMGGEIPSNGEHMPVRPGSSVAATAGFMAGFVYWVIAGRLAGCWKLSVQSREEGK